MKLDLKTGMVTTARYVASPNCDARPENVPVDVLVVHSISLPPGRFGGPFIENLFCNCLDPSQHEYFSEICHLKVSAHFLIRRKGGLLQFVPTHLRAWHAGESRFNNRTNVNDFSVGVELEGTDDKPFTDAQYDKLIELTQALMSAYPGIRTSTLVAHSDIAPGRKTDPGQCFDWNRYLQALRD